MSNVIEKIVSNKRGALHRSGIHLGGQPAGDGQGLQPSPAYLEGIKKLHDAGIAVQTGLVFGFDHDDVTVFERTLEFLEQAGVDVASIGSLTPFPGTPIFRKLEEEGRILTRDWSKYNARTDVVFRRGK